MVQSLAVRQAFSRVFSDGSNNLRTWVAGSYLLLIAASVGAWVLPSTTFRQYPVLLGTASCGLGLRHAVDAGHLAAVDNGICKLKRDDTRPAGGGLCFFLRHSTIVLRASVAIAAAATASKDRFD